jgi:lipopolysaccharide export system permease protein
MMSLIGLPLGLQARPGKKAIGIQAGLAIFILYYILFTFGKDMAEEGLLPVWLAMWSPNILFFSLALFWIFRVANEQSLIPAVCSNVLKKIAAVISIPLKTVYQKISYKINHSAETTLYEKTVDLTPGPAIKGNAKSMVFHVPSCEKYNCIHCTIEFKDIHVAREAGFEPCRICKELIDTRS